MKILVFLFFSLILYSYTLNAQMPEILWQSTYGGSSLDELKGMIQTEDGGFVLVGSTGSNDFDVTENKGVTDFWIVKTNSIGIIQWQKTYGGSGLDGATSIAQTNDNGYIIGGYSNSDDGDVEFHHGSLFYCDYWIIKTDSSGNMLWQKTLGGNKNDFCFSIIKTTDDGFIVGGSSYSDNGDITAHHGTTEFPDYWIVKLDNIGNLEWQLSLGGSGYEWFSELTPTTDGGVVLIGYSNSLDGNLTENLGGYDYWVIKVTLEGSIVWQRSYGGSEDDLGNSIKQTSGNGFILAGETASNDGDVSGHHGGVYDFWCVQIDSAGNIEWQKTYGGTNTDEGFYVSETNDGGFAFSGTSNSNDGNLTEHFGGSDFWVFKTNALGELEWQKTLGGTLVDNNPIIQQLPDDRFIVGGFTYSDDIDVYGQHGGNDFWLVKLDTGCVQNTLYADLDFDGFGNSGFDTITCELYLFGYSEDSSDCDDSNNLIHPFASEICNGIDDNCNLIIDDGLITYTYFADADEDGFGNIFSTFITCDTILPLGFVLDSSDCDDTDIFINPVSIEICNGIDDNCNNEIDDGLLTFTFYIDSDGDNYGNASIDSITCYTSLTGYVPDDTDCDDTNPLIFPGAEEIFNGIDDNCNQLIDEGLAIEDPVFHNFIIYPVPVFDVLTIDFGINVEGELFVYNVLGKLVLYEKFKPMKVFSIDISNLLNGSYFIRVLGEKGKVDVMMFSKE